MEATSTPTVYPTLSPISYGAIESNGRSLSVHTVSFLLVGGCMLGLVALVFFPDWWARRRRDQQLRAARDLSRPADASQHGASRKQTEAQRYDDIEAWLVSKPVLDHDAVCGECQSSKRRTTPSAPSSLASTDDDSSSEGDSSTRSCGSMDKAIECCICCEDFAVNDIVSWSPNPTCNHVYHHGCIKEWLLKHNSCPWCREVVLPIDNVLSTKRQIQEMLVFQQDRSRPAFFCLDHAIVRPSKLQKGDEMDKRFMHMCSREELQMHRGWCTHRVLKPEGAEEAEPEACMVIHQQPINESSTRPTPGQANQLEIPMADAYLNESSEDDTTAGAC